MAIYRGGHLPHQYNLHLVGILGESTVENGRHCDSLLDTGGALKRRGVVREGGGGGSEGFKSTLFGRSSH